VAGRAAAATGGEVRGKGRERFPFLNLSRRRQQGMKIITLVFSPPSRKGGRKGGESPRPFRWRHPLHWETLHERKKRKGKEMSWGKEKTASTPISSAGRKEKKRRKDLDGEKEKIRAASPWLSLEKRKDLKKKKKTSLLPPLRRDQKKKKGELLQHPGRHHRTKESPSGRDAEKKGAPSLPPPRGGKVGWPLLTSSSREGLEERKGEASSEK